MLKQSILALFLLLLALSPLLRPDSAYAAAPEVAADQWIVIDGPTATVIGKHDASTRRPMASLTKIMTAVVAIERGHLEMPVTITEGDKAPESSAGLFIGTTPTLQTLLHGLLLSSGNDAAMAIARAVGGSASFENSGARAQFVSWMNAKAGELGLEDTAFANPHGLDEDGHYSTPEDLAELTRYALSIPEFREIFGTKEYHEEGYSFFHSNQLFWLQDNVVGGKTGWTDGCGRCLVEVIEADGRDVVIVLMGSDLNWYNDAIALSEFAAAYPRPADSIARASRHFDLLWDRTDSLVAAGVEQRSWLWGTPMDETVESESDDSTTGSRYTRLFEKGLMEINHPYSEVGSGWYITPGRLAADLIDDQASIAVAGDLDSAGPDYADLASQNWGSQDAGEEITRRISSSGQTTNRVSLADYGVVAGSTTPETGLATASVFEDFLWQTGPVVSSGEVVDGLLFDPPVLAVGFPITEAFWVNVPENDRFVDVLVQCFERRCLTYTPTHEAAWQVEMSNIGIHHEMWRTRAGSDSGINRHPTDQRTELFG